MFDHRASIVAYLDNLASRKEGAGQRTTATELRAAATSVAAGIDANYGERGLISPVDAIIRETVAAFEGVSNAELVAPSRGGRNVERVRFAAMWVAKKRLGWGEDRLAPDFNRDRTTVAHGIARAEEIRGTDDEYRHITDILVVHDIRCPHCFVSI